MSILIVCHGTDLQKVQSVSMWMGAYWGRRTLPIMEDYCETIMVNLFGVSMGLQLGYGEIVCYSEGLTIHHRFANEVDCIRQLLAKD
ncbi:hypothetical protein L195_g000875 [Trifolium pratense]|uniref:Uncharacterized protein n=1 Tax=Trifolium pratense TaxID=57577 RepID=A0A2K3NN39_TRIPR|nr:hypothetical protein L195_g000875 [Trifolium pratense]